MFSRFSSFGMLVPAIVGAFNCVGVAHAQNLSLTQSFPDVAKVTVAVAGLTCSGSAQGSFAASTFQIAVNTVSGTGGAGAGKTVFGDLLVQKPTDGCSLPLFILAAKSQRITQVVLNAVDKADRPVLTITLEGVSLAGSQLNGSGSATNAGDAVDFSYTSITIKDVSGATTGLITR